VVEFQSITEFVNFRKNCIFCQRPLRVSLNNFLGIDGVTSIDSVLVGRYFNFTMEYSSRYTNYKTKVAVNIDADQSTLLFDYKPDTKGDKVDVAIGEYEVKERFEDLNPLLVSECTSQECGMGYYLCSNALKLPWCLSTVEKIWKIGDFHVLIEGFKTKSSVIQNDMVRGETMIYSAERETDPLIVFPMIDFKSMNKERLINRIQTIVTFS